MTFGGILASLFPSLYLATVIAILFITIATSSIQGCFFLIGFIYLIPVLIFRIHNRIYPLKEGSWDLSKKVYNPWWTSYNLQYPFIALPFLESLLHFIPGLYSVWLRSWGSEIGKNVFWTPRVEIGDRSLVVIQDDVIVGHITSMVCHLVSRVGKRPVLIVKKIHIGKGALIGADTQLGPGARIEPLARIKPKTRLYWRGTWGGQQDENLSH